MAEQIKAPLVVLRRKEVEKRTKLACSTIYERIKNKTFPAPIRLGPNSVGWLESEIDSFLAARIADRDNSEAGGR
jgi:prophage regulatory protein